MARYWVDEMVLMPLGNAGEVATVPAYVACSGYCEASDEQWAVTDANGLHAGPVHGIGQYWTCPTGQASG